MFPHQLRSVYMLAMLVKNHAGRLYIFTGQKNVARAYAENLQSKLSAKKDYGSITHQDVPFAYLSSNGLLIATRVLWRKVSLLCGACWWCHLLFRQSTVTVLAL